MHRDPFAPFFEDWSGIWEFASANETRARLDRAGFAGVRTGIEEAPTTLASEADYREFVTTVIYHPHLARLPESLRPRFIDEVAGLSAAEDPPFTLDYWRLNMEAVKP